jgi:hypothetical protein
MFKKITDDAVAHKLPADLKKALLADRKALAAWEDITPLARNEWICWTESVKTLLKRDEHIRRTVLELKSGMRRPCCWYGCTHRTDKKLSASQKFVLSKKASPRK